MEGDVGAMLEGVMGAAVRACRDRAGVGSGRGDGVATRSRVRGQVGALVSFGAVGTGAGSTLAGFVGARLGSVTEAVVDAGVDGAGADTGIVDEVLTRARVRGWWRQLLVRG